ncbi:MAG: DUF3999 domain-containing protein, partial [Flavobacteriaceae bacterium]|nr:DUF3999 domain-containing protein [Flavobacteriaceae bacterium]
VHELVARFSEPAKYFLTYGNKNATSPNYDVGRFSDKIPGNLKPLKLLEQKSIKQEDEIKKEALFTNKLWLWIIMGLIILVLGGYSIKMLKKV